MGVRWVGVVGEDQEDRQSPMGDQSNWSHCKIRRRNPMTSHRMGAVWGRIIGGPAAPWAAAALVFCASSSIAWA
jgi:hypothetical protein